MEAKNELLALQASSRQKDDQLLLLQEGLHQRDQYISQITAQLQQKTSEISKLQQQVAQGMKSSAATDVVIVDGMQVDASFVKKLQEDYFVLKQREERNSGQVHDLEQENQQLRTRDKESSQVVTQLMKDVEELRRGGSGAAGYVQTPGEGFLSLEEHTNKLDSLRAELDEMYGEQITRMKDQMRDKQAQEMTRLKGELKKVTEEKAKFSQQVTVWQQQYVLLSQQNVSNTELCEQIGSLTTENMNYREQLDSLSTQVANLLSERDQVSTDLSHSKQKLESLEQAVQCRNCKLVKSEMDSVNQSLRQARKENQELNRRLDSLESDLNASRQDFVKLRASHDSEIQNVRQGYAKEIHALSASHREELEGLSDRHLSAMKECTDLNGKLSEAHAVIQHLQQAVEQGKGSGQAVSQLQSLVQQYKQELIDLKDQHQLAIQNLKSEHSHELERISHQYSSSLSKVGEKLKAEHSEILSSQAEQHSQLIESLERQHQAEIDAVQNQVRHMAQQLRETKLADASMLEAATGVQLGMKEIHSKLQEVTSERDSAIVLVQDTISEKYELKQKLDELLSEKNKLQQKVCDIGEEKRVVMQQLNQTTVEKEELRCTLMQLVEETEVVKTKLDETFSEKMSLDYKMKELSSEKSTINAELSEIQNQRDLLLGDLEYLSRERESLQQQLSQWDNLKDSLSVDASMAVSRDQASESSDLVEKLRAQFEQVKLQYTVELHQVKARLNEILQQLGSALTARQEMQSKYEAGMTQLQEQLGAASTQIEGLTMEKQQLHDKLVALPEPKDIQKIQEEYQQVLAQYQTLQGHYASCYTQLETASAENQRLAVLVKDLSEGLENVKAKDEKPNQSAAQEGLVLEPDGQEPSSVVKYESLQQSLTQAESEVMVLAQKCEDLAQDLQYWQARFDQLNEDYEKEKDRSKTLEEKRLASETKIDDLSTEIEEARKAAVFATHQIDVKDNELKEMKDKVDKLITEIDVQERSTGDRLAAAKEAFEEQLDVLKEKYDKLLEEHQSTKETLKVDQVSIIVDEITPEDYTKSADPNKEKPLQKVVAQESGDVSICIAESTRLDEELDTSEAGFQSSAAIERLEFTPEQSPIRTLSSEEEVERLKAQLETSIRQLEVEMDEKVKVQETHGHEIQELVQKVNSVVGEKEDLRIAMEKQVKEVRTELADAMQQVDAIMAEREQMRTQHVKSMEQLRQEHAAALEELNTQIVEVDAEHGLELSDVRKKYVEAKAEIERLKIDKEQLECEFVTEMQNMNQEHDGKMKSLRETYEQDLENITQEVNVTKQRLLEEQEEVTSQYSNEVELLKQECLDMAVKLQEVMSAKEDHSLDVISSSQEDITSVHQEEKADVLSVTSDDKLDKLMQENHLKTFELAQLHAQKDDLEKALEEALLKLNSMHDEAAKTSEESSAEMLKVRAENESLRILQDQLMQEKLQLMQEKDELEKQLSQNQCERDGLKSLPDTSCEISDQNQTEQERPVYRDQYDAETYTLSYKELSYEMGALDEDKRVLLEQELVKLIQSLKENRMTAVDPVEDSIPLVDSQSTDAKGFPSEIADAATYMAKEIVDTVVAEAVRTLENTKGDQLREESIHDITGLATTETTQKVQHTTQQLAATPETVTQTYMTSLSEDELNDKIAETSLRLHDVCQERTAILEEIGKATPEQQSDSEYMEKHPQAKDLAMLQLSLQDQLDTMLQVKEDITKHKLHQPEQPQESNVELRDLNSTEDSGQDMNEQGIGAQTNVALLEERILRLEKEKATVAGEYEKLLASHKEVVSGLESRVAEMEMERTNQQDRLLEERAQYTTLEKKLAEIKAKSTEVQVQGHSESTVVLGDTELPKDVPVMTEVSGEETSLPSVSGDSSQTVQQLQIGYRQLAEQYQALQGHYAVCYSQLQAAVVENEQLRAGVQQPNMPVEDGSPVAKSEVFEDSAVPRSGHVEQGSEPSCHELKYVEGDEKVALKSQDANDQIVELEHVERDQFDHSTQIEEAQWVAQGVVEKVLHKQTLESDRSQEPDTPENACASMLEQHEEVKTTADGYRDTGQIVCETSESKQEDNILQDAQMSIEKLKLDKTETERTLQETLQTMEELSKEKFEADESLKNIQSQVEQLKKCKADDETLLQETCQAMDELQNEKLQVEKALQDAQVHLDTLKKEKTDMDEILYKVQQAINTHQIEASEAESTLQNAQLELDKVKEDKAATDTVLAEVHHAIGELQEDNVRLSTSVQDAQKDVESLQETKATKEKHLQELQLSVTEMHTHNSSIDDSLKEAQLQLEKMQEGSVHATKQLLEVRQATVACQVEENEADKTPAGIQTEKQPEGEIDPEETAQQWNTETELHITPQDLEQLKEEASNFEGNLLDATRSRDQLLKEKEVIEHSLQGIQLELKKLQDDKLETEKLYHEAELSKSQLEQEKSDAEGRLKDSQIDLEKLKENRDGAEKSLHDTRMEIDELQKEKSEIQQTLQLSRENFEEEQNSKLELENAMSDMQGTLTKLRGEKAETDQKIHGCRVELEKLQEDQQRGEAELNDAKLSIEELQKLKAVTEEIRKQTTLDLKVLQDDRAQSETEVEGMKQSIQQNITKKEESAEMLNSLHLQREQLMEEVRKLEEAANDTKLAMEQLMHGKTQAESTTQHLQLDLEKLREERSSFDKTLQDTQALISELQHQTADSESAVLSAKAELQQLQAEKLKCEESHQKAQQDRELLEKEIADLTLVLEEAELNLKQLQEEKDNSEKGLNKTQTDLAQAQQGKVEHDKAQQEIELLLHNLEEEKAVMETSLQTKKETVEQLQKDTVETAASLQVIQRDLDEHIQKRLEALQDKLNAAESSLGELQVQNTVLTEENSTLRAARTQTFSSSMPSSDKVDEASVGGVSSQTIQQLQLGYQQVVEQYQALQAHYMTAYSQLQTMSTENQELGAKVKVLEQERGNIHQSSQDLKDTQTVGHSETSARKSGGSADHQKDSEAAWEKDLRDSQQAIELLKTDNTNIGSALQNAQLELQKLQAEKDQVDQALQEVQQGIDQLRRENSEAEEKLRHAEQQSESLRVEKDGSEKALLAAKQTIHELQQEQSELENSLCSMQLDVKKLEEDTVQKRTSLFGMQETLNQLLEERTETEKSLEQNSKYLAEQCGASVSQRTVDEAYKAPEDPKMPPGELDSTVETAVHSAPLLAGFAKVIVLQAENMALQELAEQQLLDRKNKLKNLRTEKERMEEKYNTLAEQFEIQSSDILRLKTTEAENESLMTQIEDLSRRSQEQQEVIAELRKEKASLEGSMSDHTEELAKSLQQLQEEELVMKTSLKEQLRTLKEQQADREDDFIKLQEDSAIRQKMLQDQVDVLEGEKTALAGQMSADVDHLTAENARLFSDNEQLRQDAENQAHDNTKIIGDLNGLVDQLKSELEKLGAEHDSLQEQLQENVTTLKGVESNLEDRNAKLKELETELSSVYSEKNDLTTDLKELKNTMACTVAGLEAQLASSLGTLESERSDSKIQLGLLKDQHGQQCLTLKERVEELQSQRDSFRTEVNQMKEDHSQYVIDINEKLARLTAEKSSSQEDFQNVLDDLKAEHLRTVDRLQAETHCVQQEREDLQRAVDEHCKEIEKIKAKYSKEQEDSEAEKELIQSNHIVLVEKLSQEHVIEVAQLKEQLASATESHTTQTQSLCLQLEELGQELDGGKRQIEALEQEKVAICENHVKEVDRLRTEQMQAMETVLQQLEQKSSEREEALRSVAKSDQDRETLLAEMEEKLKEADSQRATLLSEFTAQMEEAQAKAEETRKGLLDDMSQLKEKLQLTEKEKEDIANEKYDINDYYKAQLESLKEDRDLAVKECEDLRLDLKKQEDQVKLERDHMSQEHDQMLKVHTESLETCKAEHAKVMEEMKEELHQLQDQASQELEAVRQKLDKERKNHDERVKELTKAKDSLISNLLDQMSQVQGEKLEKEQQLQIAQEVGEARAVSLRDQICQLQEHVRDLNHRLELAESAAEDRQAGPYQSQAVDAQIRDISITPVAKTVMEMEFKKTKAVQVSPDTAAFEESCVTVEEPQMVQQANTGTESIIYPEEKPSLSHQLETEGPRGYEVTVKEMQAHLEALARENAAFEERYAKMEEQLKQEHTVTVHSLNESILALKHENKELNEALGKSLAQDHENPPQASEPQQDTDAIIENLKQQLLQITEDKNNMKRLYDTQIQDLRRQISDHSLKSASDDGSGAGEFHPEAEGVLEIASRVAKESSDSDTDEDQLMKLKGALDCLQQERDLLRSHLEQKDQVIGNLQDQLNVLVENPDQPVATAPAMPGSGLQDEIESLKFQIHNATEQKQVIKQSLEKDIEKLSRHLEKSERARKTLEAEVKKFRSLSSEGNLGETNPAVAAAAIRARGKGIFSDSIQAGENSLSVDHAELFMRLEDRSVVRQPSQDSGTAVSSDHRPSIPQDVQQVIDQYEEKITKLTEQHEIEINVLEYNLSEGHGFEVARLRAEIKQELEDEQKEKMVRPSHAGVCMY